MQLGFQWTKLVAMPLEKYCLILRYNNKIMMAEQIMPYVLGKFILIIPRIV